MFAIERREIVVVGGNRLDLRDAGLAVDQYPVPAVIDGAEDMPETRFQEAREKAVAMAVEHDNRIHRRLFLFSYPRMTLGFLWLFVRSRHICPCVTCVAPALHAMVTASPLSGDL